MIGAGPDVLESVITQQGWRVVDVTFAQLSLLKSYRKYIHFVNRLSKIMSRIKVTLIILSN